MSNQIHDLPESLLDEDEDESSYLQEQYNSSNGMTPGYYNSETAQSNLEQVLYSQQQPSVSQETQYCANLEGQEMYHQYHNRNQPQHIFQQTNMTPNLQYPQLSNVSQHHQNQYSQENYNLDQHALQHHQTPINSSTGSSHVAPDRNLSSSYSTSTSMLANRQNFRTQSQQVYDQRQPYMSQNSRMHKRYDNISNQSYGVPVQELFFHQTSNYFPIVGSNCTVVTTSPMRVDEEVDVFDFLAANENDNLISNLPSSVMLKSTQKTAGSSSCTHSTNQLHVRSHITTSTGLEEEDDEEDCEPVAPNTINQEKTSIDSVNKIKEQSEEVPHDLPTTPASPVKKSRKQQLPSSSKESITIIVKTPPTPKRVKILIKPKKEELTRNIAVDKEAASNAQAQAIQRIGTMEGWKRMNEWLRVAESAKNFINLKTLLAQCLEANITMELLLSNDTPKFVMYLSKNSEEKDVMELATKLVSKWKKVIKSGDSTARAPKKADKTPKVEFSQPSSKAVLPKEADEKLKDEVTSESKKDTATATGSLIAGKTRPKTAKAKISKPRSTGLEGDDESVLSKTVKRRPVPASVTLSQKAANTSILGDILAAANVPPKIQISKRSIMLSDSFMDALEDQTVAPKKPKIIRKKLNPTQPQTNISLVGPSVGFESNELYSDTLKKLTNKKENVITTLALNAFENDKGCAAPGRRRIQFADEKGLNLVEVRLFEIEEGERVNVTKMSSEDMKHCEMQHERIFIRDQKGFHFMPSNLPMPQGFGGFRQSGFSTSLKPWRLVLVDGVIELIEHGQNSESKNIEIKRRNTVMEAFYDAFTSLQVSEIDDCDYPRGARDHVPKIIPLEAVSSPPLTDNAGTVVAIENNPQQASLLSSSLNGQRLPLPFAATTYSRLASQLPPAVAALMANLPASVAASINPSTKSKTSFSPNSIVEKNLESSTSPSILPFVTESSVLSGITSNVSNCDIDAPASPDPPESPDDTDIRSLEASNDMEDTDIRCIPSEQQNSPPLALSRDEDVDIRFGALPAFVKNAKTIATAESSSVSVGVGDVHALMNSLKKSGFMDSANLAGILNKFQNIEAIGKLSIDKETGNRSSLLSNDEPKKPEYSSFGASQSTIPGNAPVLPTPAQQRPPDMSGGVHQPPTGPPHHIPSGYRGPLPHLTSGRFPLPPTGMPRFSHFPPVPNFRYGRMPLPPSGGRFMPLPHNVNGPPRFFLPSSTSSSHYFLPTSTLQSGAPPPLMGVITDQTGINSASPTQFSDTNLSHQGQQTPQSKLHPFQSLTTSSFSTMPSKCTSLPESASALNESQDKSFNSKVNAFESIKTSSFGDFPSFLQTSDVESATFAEPDLSALENLQVENASDADLMPVIKTFVKQCSYYQNGDCHFGDACRFAHGSDMTLGVRQMIATIRNRRGGGGFRNNGGCGRFIGTPRPSAGRTSINVVGGGVEIDYEDRSLQGGQTGSRRFSSPSCRGGGNYHNSGRYTSGRRGRKSRSNSPNMSPIRNKRHSRTQRSSPRYSNSSWRHSDRARSPSRRSKRSGSSTSATSNSPLDDSQAKVNETVGNDVVVTENVDKGGEIVGKTDEKQKRLASSTKRRRLSPKRHNNYRNSGSSRSPARQHHSQSRSSVSNSSSPDRRRRQRSFSGGRRTSRRFHQHSSDGNEEDIVKQRKSSVQCESGRQVRDESGKNINDQSGEVSLLWDNEESAINAVEYLDAKPSNTATKSADTTQINSDWCGTSSNKVLGTNKIESPTRINSTDQNAIANTEGKEEFN